MRKVVDIIQGALNVPASEITNVHAMGGMTNINYRASVGDEHFIVRIPGMGTSQFINRKEEEKNLDIGVQLGINPEHICIDAETGLKITRMIPGAITLTSSDTKEKETMKKITDVLRTLHRSNVQMDNQFKLYELMEHYENNAIEANAEFYPNFEEVKKEVLRIKLTYDELEKKESPCHIDALSENFVMDGEGKLYLIDWEYSGMFDPLWDVATMFLESDFDVGEESLFLGYYFEREATEDEKKRIHIHKVFQDYLWSIWTLFKEASGDHFGSYGNDRFDRLQVNLTRFDEKYGQGILQ